MLRKLLVFLLASVSFAFNATIGPLIDTHQEEAYFLMFETLAREDAEFIAVDLSGALLKDTSKLVEMMRAWCDEREIEFMLDDWAGLDEKGLIEEDNGMIGWHYTVDGGLIRFSDVSLTRNTLVTNTGVAGSMAGYRTTIRRVFGKWVITERKMTWIV